MVATLLLLLVANPLQDKVEKIHLKNTLAETVYERVKGVTIEGLKRVAYDPTDNSFIAQGTPQALARLKELIAEIDNERRTETIGLRNNAASYMVWVLKGGDSGTDGFIPKGAETAVDKVANGVIVTGTPDQIREIEGLIEQLDVKPPDVKIDFRATLPKLNRLIESGGIVQTNATWSYTDKTSATSIRITPRLNNDGTVVLAFVGGALDTQVISVHKLSPKQILAVRIYPGHRFVEGTNQVEPAMVIESKVGEIDATAFLSGQIEPGQGWSRQDGGAATTIAPQAELRFIVSIELP